MKNHSKHTWDKLIQLEDRPLGFSLAFLPLPLVKQTFQSKIQAEDRPSVFSSLFSGKIKRKDRPPNFLINEFSFQEIKQSIDDNRKTGGQDYARHQFIIIMRAKSVK